MRPGWPATEILRHCGNAKIFSNCWPRSKRNIDRRPVAPSGANRVGATLFVTSAHFQCRNLRRQLRSTEITIPPAVTTAFNFPRGRAMRRYFLYFQITVLGGLAAGVVLTPATKAGDVGYIEEFALARDRGEALKQLIPGTED